MGALLQDLQDVKECIISTVVHWKYVDVRDEAAQNPPPQYIECHL